MFDPVQKPARGTKHASMNGPAPLDYIASSVTSRTPSATVNHGEISYKLTQEQGMKGFEKRCRL
jgi:hypothetical protein